MSSRSATLRLIWNVCRGRDRDIERALRDNRRFRELCHDYRRCAVARERWQQCEDQDTDGISRDYSELLAEMAAEIEVWLRATGTGTHGPSGGVP